MYIILNKKSAMGLLTGMANFFMVMVFHIGDDREDQFHNLYGTYGQLQLLTRLSIALYGWIGAVWVVNHTHHKRRAVCVVIASMNLTFVVLQITTLRAIEALAPLKDQDYLVNWCTTITPYIDFNVIWTL